MNPSLFETLIPSLEQALPVALLLAEKSSVTITTSVANVEGSSFAVRTSTRVFMPNDFEGYRHYGIND
jgi:hypothetical protein